MLSFFLISYFADVDLSDRFRKGSSSLTRCIKDGIELLSPFSFMFMLALGHTVPPVATRIVPRQTRFQKTNWQPATAFNILKVIMYSDSNAHSRPTTTVKCDIPNLTQSDSSTGILLPVDSATDSKFQLGERQ